MAPRLARTDGTRRVIGYVRVSTREQVLTGYGLESQREQLAEACTRRGWVLVDVLADEGVSGSKPYRTRPGLMAAVDVVERHEADTLVVWRADRLGRLAVDGFWLLDRADHGGWSLVDLEADADSSTRSGAFVWGLRLVVAQDERRAISDRTRDAMAVAKARGVRIGRPRTLSEEVVSRIVRERAAGSTLARIGADLEDAHVSTSHGGARWWPATVKAVLKSQAASRLAVTA
jgi:DNA invertase Pin-like site-specific DNA recombinase